MLYTKQIVLLAAMSQQFKKKYSISCLKETENNFGERNVHLQYANKGTVWLEQMNYPEILRLLALNYHLIAYLISVSIQACMGLPSLTCSGVLILAPLELLWIATNIIITLHFFTATRSRD